jgi:hypothetical protein
MTRNTYLSDDKGVAIRAIIEMPGVRYTGALIPVRAHLNVILTKAH